MRRCVPKFAALICAYSSWAAQGDFAWVKHFSSSIRSQYVDGYTVAVDSAGAVYTAGRFSGTVNFDVGGSNETMQTSDSTNTYIAKYDNAGTCLWRKQFESTVWVMEPSIAVDSSGNVFIAGYCSGITDFDPGPGVANFTTSGAYTCKLDTAGNYVWAKVFAGAGDTKIALDSNGDVYTTGKFGGTIDFNPGPGQFTLTAVGRTDAYISKLSNGGDFIWARSLGGPDYDIGNSLSFDSANNVLVSGSFQTSADFDPGSNSDIHSAVNDYESFLVKLDASGSYIWGRDFGGRNFESMPSVAVDSGDNSIVCGTFAGTCDFDPGPSNLEFTATGDVDTFALKLNAVGDLVWARHFACSGGIIVYDITVDPEDNLYMGGDLRGNLVFDPGGAGTTITSIGYIDVLIAKLSSNGNLLLTKQMGGWVGWATSLALDPLGSIFVTGSFRNRIDFDPGPGEAVLNELAYDNDNGFVLKLTGYYPRVTSITCASANPTTSTLVTFTVTFEQDVSGVDETDFALSTSGISGASVVSVSGSGSTRTVIVNTGTGSGTIRLDVVDDDTIVGDGPIGGIGAGNGSFTAGETYTVDKALPTVTLASSAQDPTNTTTVPVTIEFSKPVSGFEPDEIAVTNCAIENFSGSGAVYMLQLVANSDGPLSAQVPAGVCSDGLGNLNSVSTVFSRVVDTSSPTVSVSTTVTSPTNASHIPVTIVFNEAVTGFSISDVSVTNATVTNFTESGAAYAVDLAPIGSGAVSISIAPSVAADEASNGNAASNVLSLFFDNVPPVIELVGPGAIYLDDFGGYAELGASATDDFDGDVTPQLAIDYPLHPTQPGAYFISYDVADASGNSAETKFRIVVITGPPGTLPVTPWLILMAMGFVGTLALRKRRHH